jgi:hypothetical protein
MTDKLIDIDELRQRRLACPSAVRRQVLLLPGRSWRGRNEGSTIGGETRDTFRERRRFT